MGERKGEKTGWKVTSFNTLKYVTALAMTLKEEGRETLGFKAIIIGVCVCVYNNLKSCCWLGREDVSVSSLSSQDAQGSMETRG